MHDLAPGQIEVLPFPSDGLGPKFEGRSVDGRWRCDGRLEEDGSGRFIISSLQLVPWDPEDKISLSTDALRKIPLARWLAIAHATITDVSLWLATGELSFTPDDREVADRASPDDRPFELERGPKGYPPEHYRRIARHYLRLQSVGMARGIVQQIATEQDPPRQWQTIRDWLHRATELGYLSPGVPGRAGRTAGPNLYPEVDE